LAGWGIQAALTFPLTGTQGGTGVNNGSFTETLSGNVTFTGAFNPTFAIPASATFTFPSASATLATLGANIFTGTQTVTSTGISFALPTDAAIGTNTGSNDAVLRFEVTPPGNNPFVFFSGGVSGTAIGAIVEIGGVNAMNLKSNGVFSIASGNSASNYTTIDTSLGRISSGIWGFGTTVGAGTGGGWQATKGIWLNPVAVGSLPSCASSTLGQRQEVNDATLATPGSTAVGSGTYTIAVQCIVNSTGPTYTWIID
jgi:hypothetical protein